MFEWFVKKLSKDNRGFTLIELVVVIAILGILAFIAVPKLAGTTDKATVSAHNTNVRTLESAANMYIAEEGKPNGTVTWNGTETNATKEWEAYIQEWPKVPKGLPVNEGEPVVGEYTVTISKEGKIEVKPDKQESTN